MGEDFYDKTLNLMTSKGLSKGKKRGFYLGPYEGISEVFDSDPWFRKFYMAIATFYGIPFSTNDALSKQGKILSAFGSINITLALEEGLKVWHPWWKEKREVTPELAEEFCRAYFEKTGQHIVPCYQDLKAKSIRK